MRIVAFAFWLAGWLALTLGPALKADADEKRWAVDARYRVIVERNAFALKPASALDSAAPAEASALPFDIKLTGLSSLAPRKQAFFMTAAPGEPAKYHCLVEGQEQGRLKLLAVDLPKRSVELLIDGQPHRLSFETHGFDLAFLSSGPQTPLEELRFNEEHTRAHEERERRELLRIEQERAEAETELRQRAREGARGIEGPDLSQPEPAAFPPTDS